MGDVKLSDEDSSSGDEDVKKAKKPQLGAKTRRQQKAAKSMEEKSPPELPKEVDDSENLKDQEAKSTRSQTNKVSMVAAIFRAKKNKKPEVLDEGKFSEEKSKGAATRV